MVSSWRIYQGIQQKKTIFNLKNYFKNERSHTKHCFSGVFSLYKKQCVDLVISGLLFPPRAHVAKPRKFPWTFRGLFNFSTHRNPRKFNKSIVNWSKLPRKFVFFSNFLEFTWIHVIYVACAPSSQLLCLETVEKPVVPQ